MGICTCVGIVDIWGYTCVVHYFGNAVGCNLSDSFRPENDMLFTIDLVLLMKYL